MTISIDASRSVCILWKYGVFYTLYNFLNYTKDEAVLFWRCMILNKISNSLFSLIRLKLLFWFLKYRNFNTDLMYFNYIYIYIYSFDTIYMHELLLRFLGRSNAILLFIEVGIIIMNRPTVRSHTIFAYLIAFNLIPCSSK